MTEKLDKKLVLKCTLEAKRVSRSGIENSYIKLDEWRKLRKNFLKEGRDSSYLDIKISVLEKAIDYIENTESNFE